MVDGASLLMAMFYGMRGTGAWSDERGTNMLDGGAPFYDTYETSDGRYMAVGAIEPQFYAALLRGLGLGRRPAPPARPDAVAASCGAVRRAFLTRTQDEWTAIFDGTDACVAPVLASRGARTPAHRRPGQRRRAGRDRPTRPGATVLAQPARRNAAAAGPGRHTAEVLAETGFDADALVAAGVAVQA